MLKFDKWFLPSHEKHLQEWMQKVNKRVDGRLTYQYHKYEAALKECKHHRVAIDVGAHVGLWSYFMARDFQDLAAFEPMQAHRDCWHLNMKVRANAEIYGYALGKERKNVAMMTDNFSTGNTRVDDSLDAENVEMYPLDSFKFTDVDLIKIDCEGYEMDVLLGARQTLLRCKPCVIVEQKGDMAKRYGHDEKGAVHYLESLGAVVRGATSGDYILSWE